MSDYEYEYSEDEYEYEEDGGGEEEAVAEDDPRIQIENNFVIAEDTKERDPKEALRLFDAVISEEEATFGEEVTWRFKALLHTVELQMSSGAYADMLERYERLLSLIHLVTSNEGNEAVSRVLEKVESGGVPGDVARRVFERTLGVLKGQNERMWFSTATRVAQSYAEEGDVERLREAVAELHASVRDERGEDDLSKTGQLLEVYALKVRIAAASKSWGEVKRLHERVVALAGAAVADPRVMGNVHETFAKMHMERSNWDEAYLEWFECFKAYQAAGNPRAVAVLRYVLLCSMIAGMKVDPFDTQEAKAYEKNAAVDALVRLRRAYDEGDVDSFMRVVNHPDTGVEADEILSTYLQPLLRNVRCDLILRIVRPYSAIRVAAIAKHLAVDHKTAEKLVVRLILEKRLDASFDQVDQVLHLHRDTKTAARSHLALQHAAKALQDIAHAFTRRIDAAATTW